MFLVINTSIIIFGAIFLSAVVGVGTCPECPHEHISDGQHFDHMAKVCFDCIIDDLANS